MKGTPSTTTMYTTFADKNTLLHRLDKIPDKDQLFIFHKTVGWLSVQGDSMEYFWVTLEKYILEYENRQPSLFEQPTGNKIDNFARSVLSALDKGCNF